MIDAEVLTIGPFGGYDRIATVALPDAPAFGQSILTGEGASYRIVDVVWELTEDNAALDTLTLHVEKR